MTVYEEGLNPFFFSFIIPLSTQFTMSSSTFSELNKTFIHESEEREINENLCFNTERLNLCRSQKDLKKKMEKSLIGYGKLASDELELVDLRQIHGLEPIGKGKHYRQRGFQTRADKDFDKTVVDDIAADISKKDWDHTLPQGALFLLPEHYQYYRDDGIKVIYGIANLTHRYEGAKKAVEENIIAWILDISLSKLRKWATAEGNFTRGGRNDRSKEDIIQSVLADMKDKNTDLYKKLKDSEESEEIAVEEVLEREVSDYHVNPRSLKSIVSSILHKQTEFKPDRKRWKTDQMKDHVSKKRPSWVPISNDISKKGYDYEFGSKFIILVNTEGDGLLRAALKYGRHLLSEYSHKQVILCLGTDKAVSINEDNKDDIRNNYKNIFREYFRVFVESCDFEFDGIIMPLFKWFPEVGNEGEHTDFIDY